VAILPCLDLAASEAWYAKLGYVAAPGGYPDYRILHDTFGQGGSIHLTPATPGWLDRSRNPFGLYLYTPLVDRMVSRVRQQGIKILEGDRAPEHKEWGMYEFSLSDPDETLVRIGWPSDKIRAEQQARK
jgi:hypothetical protein